MPSSKINSSVDNCQNLKKVPTKMIITARVKNKLEGLGDFSFRFFFILFGSLLLQPLVRVVGIGHNSHLAVARFGCDPGSFVLSAGKT